MKENSLSLHKKLRGKIEVKSRIKVKDARTLSLVYTPGVADVCRAIQENEELVFEYTNKWNSVAIVSDGSSILGLGDIGPKASLPVMEGKAILFKELGCVDGIPLCVDVHRAEDIISLVQALAPSFGGINLEDISSPKCFLVEQELRRTLDIPVFHDDQHGTAIAILAALRNALRIVKKDIKELKIVVLGIGAAGLATIKMLLTVGAENIVAVDRKGILSNRYPETLLNEFHVEIARVINPENLIGQLDTAMRGADVFIGTSVANLVNEEMVRSMARDPVVFALANPVPEIMPERARAAGATIVATGRSDYSNQINNVLVFPGVFRGALDVRAKDITENMKLAASIAIADTVGEDRLSIDYILPSALDPAVARRVANAVSTAAIESKTARISV